MQIQKHTIYQFSVPFSTLPTEDEIVFSRYLLVNCFSMENVNYIQVEVEEIYDSKTEPTQYRKMRVIDHFQFEELELPGTLHIMLGALSNKELSGNTEMVFLMTLFTEIMFKEPHLDKLKNYFPKWNIDDLIEQSKVPGNLSKLFRVKKDMEANT